MLAFGFVCAMLIGAPYEFSGFWPVTYDYFPQAVFLALTAVVCLLTALHPFQQPARRLNNRIGSDIGFALSGFMVCCTLSTITAVYRHDALLELERVLGALSWFWIARAHLRNDSNGIHATLLLLSIALSSILVCGVALLGFMGEHTRQPATFYNSNLFATFVAMSLPLILGAMFSARKALWARAGKVAGAEKVPIDFAVLASGAVMFLIGVGGLLVSYSKGGLLAAVVGLAVFVVAAWRARGETARKVLWSHRRVAGVGAAVFLMVAGALFFKTVWPRLQSMGGAESHSSMFRVYTWKSTLEMANARPLLGWGTGDFSSAFGQFAQAGFTRSAHQSWLQIAGESGWPALLLLAIATLLAARKGWRQLRGENWAIAAASLGALAALWVHGCTDSGWGILSIVLLFTVILAVLDAPASNAPIEEKTANVPQTRGGARLNYLFLLFSLGFALLASKTFEMQTAENLMAQSQSKELLGRDPTSALQKAYSAIQADPFSARMRTNYARIFEARGAAESAAPIFDSAIALQPTRAANWLNRAEFRARHQAPRALIQADFDRAVSLAPNDSKPWLNRAQWKESFDPQGALADYQRVAQLFDAPLGKYPATPEVVNFDFAHAYLKLGAHALEAHDIAAAKTWIARGLADIQKSVDAEKNNPALYESLRQFGDISGLQRERDDLQSALQALQMRLK